MTIKTHTLSKISCGDLKLPSGKPIACDPFAGPAKENNLYVKAPPRSYPVIVILADVSERVDRSHVREAYMSLLLNEDKAESLRHIITPLHGDEHALQEMDQDGSYHGFPVDAGTACFTDAEAAQQSISDENTWYEELFENNSPEYWFNQMDNETNIRDGIANIRLPLAVNDKNIALYHSGWGDGHFPVVGG